MNSLKTGQSHWPFAEKEFYGSRRPSGRTFHKYGVPRTPRVHIRSITIMGVCKDEQPQLPLDGSEINWALEREMIQSNEASRRTGRESASL